MSVITQVLRHTPDRELAQRNEEKLAAAKARLGEKWILHPNYRVKRKPDAKRSTP